MPTSAGKVKKYDGPNNHHAIIKQISKDSYGANYKLSYDSVERIVRLFFGRHWGIGSLLRRGKHFFIKGFGYFLIDRKYQAWLTEERRKARLRRNTSWRNWDRKRKAAKLTEKQ